MDCSQYKRISFKWCCHNHVLNLNKQFGSPQNGTKIRWQNMIEAKSVWCLLSAAELFAYSKYVAGYMDIFKVIPWTNSSQRYFSVIDIFCFSDSFYHFKWFRSIEIFNWNKNVCHRWSQQFFYHQNRHSNHIQNHYYYYLHRCSIICKYIVAIFP